MFKLFKLFDVPINIHWSFLLLLLYIGPTFGLIVTSLIVASMLMHEFGHILTARRFGYRTSDVTAMGLGMVASITSDIKRGELLIAAAGPAVNFVIAIALLGLQYLLQHTHTFQSLIEHHTLLQTFTVIHTTMIMNLIIGAFNLIPLFPLDGGRITRAIVSHVLDDRVRATRIAAWIGTIMTIMLVPIAIINGDVMLFIIAPLTLIFSWHEVQRLEKTGIEPKLYSFTT